MSAEIILLSAGQIVILGGYFFWLLKRLTNSMSDIRIDVAVIKERIQYIQNDHDLLILMEAQSKKHDEYISDLYTRMRTFQ